MVNNDLWWAVFQQNILPLHISETYFLCSYIFIFYGWVVMSCWILDFLYWKLRSILIRNTFNNYEQFLMHVQSQPVFLDWYTKSWPSITPSRVESYKAFKGYLADSCLIHFDTAHKRNVYSHVTILVWY